ncbi:MAG: type IVB secretion system protein IcmG/DotF [Legionellales bacterium]
MADNDEYEYSELESLDDESMGKDAPDNERPVPAGDAALAEKKDVKRNSLIVVGLVVFALIMYHLLGAIFGSKPKPTQEPAIPTIAQIAPQTPQAPLVPQPLQTEITSAPIQQAATPVQEKDTDLKQQVAAIAVNQQSMRSDVSSFGDEVSKVNNNVNDLNSEIAKLNQVIVNLSNQVAKQSGELTILMARSQPKKTSRPLVRQDMQSLVTYNIQAAIPGRAWLIGSNGSILTVREGTVIKGYGVIKLIDSMQGRVLTSSGRVIKFSQEDS